MADLKTLSEQANAFSGTYFSDCQAVSALLNQYLWTDGKLHDVMDIGWQTSRFAGIHFVRVEALDGWQTTAWDRILSQRCLIEQIYAGAPDGSECITHVGPEIAV